MEDVSGSAVAEAPQHEAENLTAVIRQASSSRTTLTCGWKMLIGHTDNFSTLKSYSGGRRGAKAGAWIVLDDSGAMAFVEESELKGDQKLEGFYKLYERAKPYYDPTKNHLIVMFYVDSRLTEVVAGADEPKSVRGWFVLKNSSSPTFINLEDSTEKMKEAAKG